MDTPDPPFTRGTRAVFTCAGCTNTWRGYHMAHCSTCHHTFGSVRSFDTHRTFGTCKDPTDMGLTYNHTRNCWSETYINRTKAVETP